MEEALVEIRQKFSSNSKEIYLPFHLSVEIPGAKLLYRRLGIKANCRAFRKECPRIPPGKTKAGTNCRSGKTYQSYYGRNAEKSAYAC